MFNLRSLKRCQIIALVLITLISLGAWQLMQWTKNVHQDQVRTSINTLLDTTHQAIISWSRLQKQAVSLWANNPNIIELTTKLTTQPDIAESLIGHPAQAELRRILSTVIQQNNYTRFLIISPNYRNIAASENDLIGQHNPLIHQIDILKVVKAGQSALSAPVWLEDAHHNRSVMYAAAPIRIADRVIAILAFEINTKQDFTRILQRSRLGKTGETYAFNQQGQMVSNSRFDAQLREIGLLDKQERSILNISLRDPGINLIEHPSELNRIHLRPLTEMAASATRGEQGIHLSGYPDYRGVEVVGAWLWDHQLNMGFATEIDSHEVYRLLKHDYWIILTSTILLIGMSLLLLFFSYRKNKELTLNIESHTSSLNEQLNFHEALLDNIDEGILVIDTDGQVMQSNARAQKLSGFSSEQLCRKYFTDLLKVTDKDLEADERKHPVYQCYMYGQHDYQTPMELVNQQGEYVDISVNCQPFYRYQQLAGAIIRMMDARSGAEST